MRFPAKITSSCIWVDIRVDWVILHWYACGADARSLGRCTVTWLPNFLGWVDYFIFLPIVLRWRASRARAPLKSGFWLILKFHRGPYLKFQIHFKQLSTTTSISSFSAKSVALVKKKSGKNNRLDDIWHSTLRPTDDKCKCLERFDVFFNLLAVNHLQSSIAFTGSFLLPFLSYVQIILIWKALKWRTMTYMYCETIISFASN